ncbi:probable DnaJ homolog subfamily C member 5 at C-terminar half [Coccomyxa sp. Obi]|nr:probable DnaJ homolog subfamily C member 5 at C-terminar half [Coccomyxa sp. Obi]
MGAHGTLDEALKGVDAYNAPSSEDEELLERRQKVKDPSKKRKHSKSKKDKVHRPKEKEHKKKEKKHKRHKRAKEGQSSEGASDEEDSEQDDINQQLERGRAAVRITREILQHQPGLKKELRQLLWRIDQGEAVQIAGIPDANLRQQLDELLVNINLTKTSKGIYAKRPGAAACLTLLGPVIAEAHAELDVGSAADKVPKPSPLEESAVTTTLDQPMPEVNGVEYHPSTGQDDELAESRAQGVSDISSAPVLEAADQELRVVGPAMPPPEFFAAAAEANQPVEVEGHESISEVQNGVDGASTHERGEAAVQRRVVGPAMPPAELLAAAAEAKQAMEDELDGEDDDLIGPAPPELVHELENAGSDDRSKEVIRILRVLESATAEPDAYAVVGVEPDAKAADIKKRYWRLSLLIHPDKCDHPRANDAFQAVNRAAKDLQDSGKRSAIDADREDARLRRLAAEMAAQEERERQWRVARGTATAEDLRGPIRTGPAERETWMTELPESRRPNAQPSQVNVTTFSQRGIQERGDTRGWTETPQQKLLRLSAGEAANTRAIESAPAPSAAAGAVDAYNQAHRPKTLMEQHKERLKDEKKKKKEKKRKAEDSDRGKSEGDKDTWDPKVHPWRPFDREKDLNIGPKVVTKEELMKKAGTLDSRFAGTPSGQRSFL